jgi:ABC-2 type transport system ATP-binding protein
MGPNGAGKTTLLKLIWGFLRPDQGSVQVFGLTPHLDQLNVRLRSGYMAESTQFYGWMKAWKFLEFTACFYDTWEPEWVSELSGRFSVDLDKRIDQLSRGNRAKLALMAATAHRPRLLLLDEPTSGLDPIVRIDILEFLNDLSRNDGTAIVLSSHITDDLDQIAHKVLMLHEGRCVEFAPAAVLLRQYNLPKLETVFLHAIGKIPENNHCS